MVWEPFCLRIDFLGGKVGAMSILSTLRDPCSEWRKNRGWNLEKWGRNLPLVVRNFLEKGNGHVLHLITCLTSMLDFGRIFLLMIRGAKAIRSQQTICQYLWHPPIFLRRPARCFDKHFFYFSPCTKISRWYSCEKKQLFFCGNFVFKTDDLGVPLFLETSL